MKLLIDECVDCRFAGTLSGHVVKTVPQMGWTAIQNGQLLSLAEGEFDVFITVDRGLPSQQNLSRRKIAVLVMRAKTNRLVDLEPLAPKVLVVLSKLKPGSIVVVDEDESPPQNMRSDIVADAPKRRKLSARSTA